MAASVVLVSSRPALLAAEAGAEKPAINGVIEAVTACEIRPGTRHLGPFKLERVVPHGSLVTAGQPLAWFESEAIDRKLAEAEIALELSRVALEAAEFSHTHALEVEEIERRKAERRRTEARQAHDNFMAVDRERQLQGADFERTQARASLENATEELSQLQQMYEADDLTEESEEIVLKRARQAVKAAEFRLAGVEVTSDRTITQVVPRATADQADALAAAELAFERTTRELGDKRKQRELELGRTRRSFAEEKKQLAEMKEERRRLVLTSPIAGIALHGPLTRGRLTDKSSGIEPGQSIAADRVVITVVDPGRLQVRLDLDEKHATTVKPGDACRVRVAALGGLEVAGRVESVARVPFSGTRYDGLVRFEGAIPDAGLRPLLTCEVELAAQAKPAEGDKSAAKPAEGDKSDAKPAEGDESAAKPAEGDERPKKKRPRKGAKSAGQVVAVAGRAPGGPATSAASEPVRAAILDDALDFSHEPELPEIDSLAAGEIRTAIDRGVQFLLAAQNDNGSWGSPRRTKGLNIYAPVPGAHHAFQAATTALCLSALVEVGCEEPAVAAAVDRAEGWLFDHLEGLRRATGDAIYNVWGHGYAISALARMHRRHAGDPAKQTEIEDLIRLQFQFLERYESVDGGWGYYDFRYQARQPTSDSISFVNGAILVSLAEAREIGVEPPARIVERAVAATRRQQKPDFSYLYGEYLKYQPMRGINRPGGSLGRTQCCNAALRAWGDDTVTDNVIKNWLYRLYVRNGWLDIARKRPVPHESWMQVAGYFYYFGHYYAAVSLEQLPAADRGPYRQLLASLLLARQEKDGSWWDYPLYDYHQAYGTAFALQSLVRCLP